MGLTSEKTCEHLYGTAITTIANFHGIVVYITNPKETISSTNKQIVHLFHYCPMCGKHIMTEEGREAIQRERYKG